MAVKDKFVLEISAQLKKDGNQLVNDLKTTIGEIEKNTKLDLGVDEEKVNKYLEKLKASLSEINSAMNNAGLEANSTAFRNFVDVLKEGANYSKEIATSLQKASGIIGKIDDFNNSINAAKNKAKLTKNEKDLTIGELQNKRNLKSTREEQLKTLKSTYKEYSKYDISKSLKGNIEKNINELGQDLSNLNIDISNTDEVNNEIERIKKNVTELVGELDKVEIESYKKDNLNNLKKQLKLKTEIEKLKSDMVNNSTRGNNLSANETRKSQINTLTNELNELEAEQKKIIENFNKINSSEKLPIKIDDLKGTREYDSYMNTKNKYDVNLSKRNDKLDERYSKYSGFEEDEKLYTKNENSSYNKYVNEYKKILGEYQAKINEFKSTDNKVTNFNIDELVEYENKLKELLRLLNSKDFKDPTVRLLDDGTSFKEARSEIQKLIDDEGKLIKKSLETKYISPNITEITACYKEQDGQIRKVAFSYNELTGAITKTNKASQDVATTSKFDTFGDKLKKKFGDLGAYLASFASFYEVVNVIKQGFNVIKDLDTQLTEMQKVSNESLSNLQAYAKSSFDIASQIGTTGKELQASTADYMRLGKSLQDASELAKTTNVLMNVSEFESIDKATESMISMTQAYQDLDSMDIVDKLNLTGNNYSISTDELAQSLQKSASALKTAKNDFDEAIALTVAGNSVVQDPDSVAAGIRTIALRMTGTDTAKKELEDMGEEADNVLTKSKLNDTLEMLTNIDSRGGISLLDDNGNYRSTAKVLMDLAERWQDIGEQDVKDGQNRQNALLEALAGKNRSNILASILNDPNLLKDVYNDVSTNYQGSAMKENEKQMQSIEGHLKQLKNTWEEFWASDNNRKFITDILDLTNGFLELANAIGGAKITLGALFGLFANFKWGEQIKTISSIIKTIGSEIASEGNSKSLLSLFGKKNKSNNTSTDKPNEVTDVLGTLLYSVDNVIDSSDVKKLEDVGEDIPEIIYKGVDKGTKKGVEDVADASEKVIVEGSNKGTKSGGLKSAKTVASNLAKFLFTTPLGLITTGVVVSSIANKLYSIYKEGLSESYKKLQDDAQSYTSKTNELNSVKESIPNLAKEYDSLKDGVSATGENLSLTNDEFQRYQEITSQIATTFPSLIDGYDSTGNAIINLTDTITSLNDAYEELMKKNANDFISNTKISDVENSFKNYSVNDSYNSMMDLLDNAGVQYKTGIGSLPIIGNALSMFPSSKTGIENSNKVLEEMSKYIDNSLNDKELYDIFSTVKTYSTGSELFEFNKYKLEEGVKKLAFNPDKSNALTNFLSNLASSTDDEEFKKSINAWESYIYESANKYKEIIDNSKQWMVAYSQTKDNYYNLDDDMRSIYDGFVKNFSEEDYDKYEGQKVDGFLNQFYKFFKSENNKEYINTLQNWRTLMTGSSGTIYENKQKIETAKNAIQKGTELSEETINNKYNIDDSILDEDENKVIDFYNKNNENVIKNIQDDTNKQIEALKEQKKSLIDEMKKNNLYNGDEVTKNVKFGNVDLNNRAVIKWNKENISKYKDAIKSWGGNPEDYLGSISTVDASSAEYDGIEIAFTPMLQTENGAEYLDANTVDNYINSLISEAKKDDGKWTNEELFKLDAEGLEINGKKIKGLIADIGETARKTGEKMHYLGEDGAINIINKQIDELKNKKNDVSDFSEFTKEELEATFSPKELKNISENIGSIDSEKLKENFKTEFSGYYNGFKEYLLDIFDTLSKTEKSYVGDNKSFAQLESNASNYSSTLAQLNTIGNDNVNINTELAQSLVAMGDEFAEYIKFSEDGKIATISNTQAVKDYIKKAQEKASVDARNSKNQAIQNYKDTTDTLVDLTNQLEKTADSEGNLDESILKNIQSTENQLDVLKRNIQYYEQLETKILGATNAFDAYNLAVQQDESQNAYATASSMVETLKNGFETGRLGTDAFKASIQGLLSDSSYREIMDIDNLDTRYNKMKEKYNELKQYFKTDSNGNPSISGIQKFVNDAYKNNLFTSNKLGDFSVKGNTTIDDFVDKLGYSKETIYSMLELIKSYDFNWGQSIFDNLTPTDNFSKTSKDIEDYTDKTREAAKELKKLLIERNKVDKTKDKDKYDELTESINKYNATITKQKNLQEKAEIQNVNNVKSYIDINDQITEAESKLDIYNKKIDEYTDVKKKGEKVNGKIITDEDISDLENKKDKILSDLGGLYAKKEKLGEPTSIEIQLATEKLNTELDALIKKRDELTKMDDGVYGPSAEYMDSRSGKQIANLNKQIEDKRKSLETINAYFNINATTTSEYDKAMNEVDEDKSEIEKGAKLKVTADTTQASKNLDSIINKQNEIKTDIYQVIHSQYDGVVDALGSNNKPKDEKSKSSNKSKFFNNFSNNGGKKVGDLMILPQALGNAYAKGKTLVGEFGAETIVDPWNGQYRVVGKYGAELLDSIPKDAIIFNHRQTEQLQKTGKISSRGKLTPDASGFMKGFAKASPYKSIKGSAFPYPQGSNIRFDGRKSGNKSTKNKNSSKSSKSKSNSSSSETKGLIDDIFDWIEIRLQRLSDKTQRYITLAENAISKTVKELGYKYAISTTKTEITNNQAGYKKYASYANALIKKAQKNGVKNASKYAKKVRDGSIDLQKISNEKILDFVNSYKEMYDKAKECDSAVLSLTAQLSDLAESLYNLPTEYAEKKIEKFSDKIDVLSAKIDYSQTYVGKNSALAEQNKYQLSIKKAYENAKKSTIKNYNSAKGKINSTKDSALKGLTSKQKKSIVSSVNANKEIHISPKYSATLQSALANYNKALEANRVACNNANKALYEYNTTIRQNTNAMYENIASYYENKRSLNDSKKSTFESQLAYRESMGYSAISESQKGVFTNQIELEQKNLDLINKELSKFNETTLRRQQKEGKISEEDLNNQLAHIEELKSSRYETITSINDLNSKLKEINITRLDYIIDDISRAIEKFKNIISIKEARGDKITEDLYISQMKSNENKIPNLLEKYKQYEEEQKFYAVTSQKYQDLEKQKDDIISEAVNIVVENEQLTDAVHELRFKKANEANDALETTIGDIEHLKDLLSDDELIDDSGKFTKSGLANIMLIGRELQTSRKKIANYRYMLEKLNESYKNGNLSLDEYNEQSRQYVKGIQNAVKDVENYKDALVDLYKQQLEKENELLDKNIEKRKEALSNKKSYYDYDKTIKNANKDINLLKNQIAALEGVGNAAAKAEVERLKSQLSEAEENLEDTKYEHMVELKLTGYDEMQKSADEVLQNLLEDITTNADMQEQVVSSMLKNIVKNYDEAYGKIQETINKTAINGETSNSLTDSIYKLSDTLTRGFDLIRTTGEIDSSTIYESGIYSGNSEKPKTVDNLLNSNLSGSVKRQVASITPNQKSVNIKVGDSATIKFDILPSDANKSVIGTSSDTKVATVTSGTSIRITGKKAGTCSVTATPVDGGKTATISVTVQDKVVKPSKNGGNKSSGGGNTGGNKSSGGGNTGGNKSSGGGNKPKTSSTLGYISNLSGTISSKSSSTNIKKVQNALNKLGIKGKNGKALTVDGKWGTNTDYAVKYFQKLNKWTGSLTADGIIGTKTKAKFRKAGYYKGGIVDNVMSLNNQEFLNMLRMNKDDGLITAKLGEGVIPKNIMPNFTQQLEKFNSLPADKILNNINNTTPNLEINIDKFMDVHGNVDKNCVNDLRQLQNDITNNITSTLTKEFRKLGYK